MKNSPEILCDLFKNYYSKELKEFKDFILFLTFYLKNQKIIIIMIINWK